MTSSEAMLRRRACSTLIRTLLESTISGRGIARALEESGRAGEMVFIGYELTEHTRRFLLSGVMDAVIDQSPRLEAREATHALAEAARGRTVDRAALAIGMQVIFRENIPPR